MNIDDEMNAMLSEEFHTKNGIPTDRRTHNLFFVTRTRAVVVWFFGIVGAATCGYMAGVSQWHGSKFQAFIFFIGVMLCVLPLSLSEPRK